MAVRAISQVNHEAQEKAIYCKLRKQMRRSKRGGHKVRPAVILRKILQSEDLVLSAYTRQGLVAVVQCSRVRAALDALADCKALMAGLCIGNLPKTLSEHCKELLANYICTVKSMWSAIFAGLGDHAWRKLDSKTLAAVRLLAPASSRSDRRLITRLMSGKDGPRIFSGFQDRESRSQIQKNLLGLSAPILDLQTLNEDNKLLHVAMGCTARLLALSRAALVREMDHGTSRDALKVFVVFALSRVEQLEPRAILDVGSKFEPDPHTWRQFAELARANGWNTDVIMQHCQIKAAQPGQREGITVQAGLAAGDSKKFDPENARLRQGRPAWRSVIGQSAPSAPDAERSQSSISPAFVRESKIRAYLKTDKEYEKVTTKIRQIPIAESPQSQCGSPSLPVNDVRVSGTVKDVAQATQIPVLPTSASFNDQDSSYGISKSLDHHAGDVSDSSSNYSPIGNNPFEDWSHGSMAAQSCNTDPSQRQDEMVNIYELQNTGFKKIDQIPINELGDGKLKYDTSEYILFGEAPTAQGSRHRTKTWSRLPEQLMNILVARRSGGPYDLRRVGQEWQRLWTTANNDSNRR